MACGCVRDVDSHHVLQLISNVFKSSNAWPLYGDTMPLNIEYTLIISNSLRYVLYNAMAGIHVATSCSYFMQLAIPHPHHLHLNCPNIKGMDEVQQRIDLASRFARGSVVCWPFETHSALCRLFENASLCPLCS